MTHRTFDKARAAYWRLVLLIKPARRRAALNLQKTRNAAAGFHDGPCVQCCERGAGCCAVARPVTIKIMHANSRGGAGVVTALRPPRGNVDGGFFHNFPSSAVSTNDNFAALRRV